MRELQGYIEQSRHSQANGGFFLNKILNLLCGDASDLAQVASGSYQAYAALDLLFCGSTFSAERANSAELFHVSKIKEAVSVVGIPNNNQLFKQLYNASAFTLLEKLLESTPYKESLMIFVFHVSHLLLRQLLYPDNEQSVKVFFRLHTYQTRKLIEKCSHLMDFNKWLSYIDMIDDLCPQERAINLLTLIDAKLDICDPDQFKLAQKAVMDTLKDERRDGEDEAMGEDRQIWLEKKYTRSYLLMKLQRAFCMRQFKHGAGSG